MRDRALRAGAIAGFGTLVFGLLFSWIATRLGWMNHVNRIAPIVVPSVVGAVVYASVRLGKPRVPPAGQL